MAAEPRASFGRNALIITLGMVLPIVPVAFGPDVAYTASTNPVPLPAVGAVEYHTFLISLAILHAVGLLLLIEHLDLDRLSFLLSSIVMPWIVVFGGVVLVLLIAGTTWADHPVALLYNRLTGRGHVIAYGTAFFMGGIGAYLLSRILDYRESTAIG